MGFLSSLTGSSSTKVPASGFYSQPGAYQSLYKSVLNNANAGLSDINASMFTPLAQTQGETNAINSINQGFTPDQQTLNSDVSMLMNPYFNNVEDQVNRDANSNYSILKQNATQAGQFGSNRQNLGANDIEQTRLSTIGNLRNQAYNTALSSVLNNIIPQQQQDAYNQLSAGQFRRGLASQTAQAPLQALQAQQSLLTGIPTQFGSFGNQAQSISGGGGLSGLLNTASSIGSIASLFSDRRLKENIEHIGQENGFNVYKFNYIGDREPYIGVMADEVMESAPHAVATIDGYNAVDYDAIGVKFRRA